MCVYIGFNRWSKDKDIKEGIKEPKQELPKISLMKELRKVDAYWGYMEIGQKKILRLSQEYIKKVRKRFNVEAASLFDGVNPYGMIVT